MGEQCQGHKNSLKRFKVVKKVNVSFELDKLYVEFGEEFLGIEEIIKGIEKTGDMAAENQ